MDRREPFSTVDGKVNYYQKRSLSFPSANMKNNKEIPFKKKKTKLKIEIPYELAILLLVIYGRKTWSERIHALQCSLQHCFTMAKTGKQPKYPLIEWTKKMWYIYTMEYCSAIKITK